MRKQGIDARQVFSTAGHKLGFTVFLWYGVKNFDGYCSERLARFRDSILNGEVIAKINKAKRANCDQKYASHVCPFASQDFYGVRNSEPIKELYAGSDKDSKL
jgi:hypothetical protein